MLLIFNSLLIQQSLSIFYWSLETSVGLVTLIESSLGHVVELSTLFIRT